jgi:hypothetical protein
MQLDIHQQFCTKYLPMTEICRNENEIKEIIFKFGISKLFIGSDSLWNYAALSVWKKLLRIIRYGSTLVPPDHNFPNLFWGCMYESLGNIPMVTFSVSSQNMPFHSVKGQLKKKMGKSLENFKQITVRDEWTKLLVEYFTNNRLSPEITPDPVFGFNNNVSHTISKEEILKKFNLPEKYILLSFRTPKIDNVWIREFENLCNKQRYSCVGFPFPEGLVSFGLKSNIQLPLDPLDWYYLIKYSSGYLGERMHPIVVSLHNSVPFYSFDEYGLADKSDNAKNASKTFDIIKQANFVENHFSYKTMTELPKPNDVFQKLVSFDTSKCNNFANNQYEKYKSTMNMLLDCLN